MNKSKSLIKALPLAMAVCGSILISTAEPASAFGWWRTDYLGRLTTRDNDAYWRSKGRSLTPTPPRNRNDLCKWKYPRSNGTVYGKAASRRRSWETNCYHRYWKWWW